MTNAHPAKLALLLADGSEMAEVTITLDVLRRLNLSVTLLACATDRTEVHGYFDIFLKEGWELDKDLISLGSKKYSNDNCCFLPRELNSKFSNVTQLFETDRGVSLLPHGTYRVNVSGVRGESSHVGCYKTKEEAVFVFRKHKSKILLESLRKYEGIIDERVVTSITNYLKSFQN